MVYMCYTVSDYAGNGTGTVNVSAHDMSAQTSAYGDGSFQINRTAVANIFKRRTPHGFMHYIGTKRTACHRRDSETNAVNGNAVTYNRIFQNLVGSYGQANRIRLTFHTGNSACFLNDSSEHKHPPGLLHMPL